MFTLIFPILHFAPPNRVYFLIDGQVFCADNFPFFSLSLFFAFFCVL